MTNVCNTAPNQCSQSVRSAARVAATVALRLHKPKVVWPRMIGTAACAAQLKTGLLAMEPFYS